MLGNTLYKPTYYLELLCKVRRLQEWILRNYLFIFKDNLVTFTCICF